MVIDSVASQRIMSAFASPRWSLQPTYVVNKTIIRSVGYAFRAEDVVSLVSKSRGRGAGAHNTEDSIAIPILCKFWSEDGVWNGVAEPLPVAVFGETFEEAKDNLRNAITAHLEAVREVGDLATTIENLLRSAKDFLSVQDIPTGRTYARIEARVTGNRVCAFA